MQGAMRWCSSRTLLMRLIIVPMLNCCTIPLGCRLQQNRLQWREERSPLIVALARYTASVRDVLAGKLKRPQIPGLPLPAEEQP